MPGPPGPGWVINSTPVTIAAGQSGQVPYPTSMSVQLNYVLVVNSSPFAVIITQGGSVLGQVPAFTAQVFPLAITGQPLGWTALQPGGVIVGGQDTTLYLTWADTPPYGQWPSAVGSSAVPFAANVISFTGNGPNTLDGAVGVSSVMDVLGYGGMVLTTNFQARTGGLGAPGAPYRFVIDWSTNGNFVPGVDIVARRQFIVAAGAAGGAFQQPLNGAATFATPHFGDFMRFAIVAPGIGTGLISVTGENRQEPFSGFVAPLPVHLTTGGAVDLMGGPFAPNVGTAIAVGAGLTVNVVSVWPYEGPAQLLAGWGFAAAAFGDWRVILSAADEVGNQWRIADYQATPGIQSAVNAQVIVPPTILVLALTNGTGAAHSVQIALTPDVADYGA